MSEPYAIISDIHGNLEALEAVLASIDEVGLERIFCLGDVVGYGPDPDRCADLVRQRCTVTIRGNHDEALFHGAERFNPFARAAIRFTRDKLKPRLMGGRKQAQERWDWLRELPTKHREGEWLFVHGSPRDATNEYVYAEDVFLNPQKITEIFDEVDRAVFCGHTHMPVVIRSDQMAWVPTDESQSVTLDSQFKYLVNVGSVGQPRDRDPRSCWVQVDGNTLSYHRVSYDHELTAKKIADERGLDEILGSRLAKGM